MNPDYRSSEWIEAGREREPHPLLILPEEKGLGAGLHRSIRGILEVVDARLSPEHASLYVLGRIDQGGYH